MLLNLSWRNVWRNKKRSVIIIAAIALGLWAGIFNLGFYEGMLRQMVDAAISSRVSHIQIHAPGFREHKEIGLTVPDGERVLEDVRSIDGVKSAAGRSVLSGMASSPALGTGAVIYGIIPDDEKRISDIYEQMVEGTYFETKKRNPVIIGKKLADELEVEIGNKIVLTAQIPDGSIGAGAFRVVGIYKTVSSFFDESTVFAQQEDIDKTFELEGAIHEIAIMGRDNDVIFPITDGLKEKYPDLKCETWKEIAPDLAYSTDASGQMIFIFMIIIMLALVFGITNTMLMGVLERVRELGVVIALGMKPGKVFWMILLETVFLSIIGGILGISTGWGTIAILNKTGIDLSIVAEGLAAFGIGTTLYPVLPAADYFSIAFMVVITAIAAAIYPGIKAVKLNPVQAIRTY